MKISIGDLKHLIREAVKSVKKKSNGDFGDYAFPAARVKGAKVPKEEDTPEEKAAYDELYGYFDLNRNISSKVANSLSTQLQSGAYNDVLKEPASSTVYRGMIISGKELQALLRLKKLPPDSGQAKGSFVYKPQINSVSSWSTSLKIAKSYSTPRTSREAGSGDRYGVILTADVSDNPGVFLSGPDGLYKLDAAAQFKKEQEALALEPVVFKSASWEKLTFNAKK